MQMQMMATNRIKAHFFNYIVFEGVEYWHEIIINRDESICDLIWDRIIESEEIKKEYINKINNNKQF